MSLMYIFINMEFFLNLHVIVQGPCWSSLYYSNFNVCAKYLFIYYLFSILLKYN